MSVEIFSLIILYSCVALVLITMENAGMVREVNKSRRWEDVAGVRSGLRHIALGVLRGVCWPLVAVWACLVGAGLLVTNGVAATVDLIRVALGKV